MRTIHFLSRIRLVVIAGLIGFLLSGSSDWAWGQDRGGDRRGWNRGGDRGDRGGRGGRGRGDDDNRRERGRRGERGDRGGDRGDRRGGGNAEDRRAQWMRSLDKNGDGKLELSEIPERMRGMFENRAKEIGFDPSRPIPIDRYLEERSSEGDHPTAFQEELQPSLAPGFDTPLTPEEQAMLFPELRREILLGHASPEVIGNGGSGEKKNGEENKSDEDTEREAEAAKGFIERYDNDKNGTIDGEEINRIPGFLRSYDADGDGKITQEETQAGMARFRSSGWGGGGWGGGGRGGRGGAFGGRGGGNNDDDDDENGDRRRGGRRGWGGGSGGPGGGEFRGGPGGRGFGRGGEGGGRPEGDGDEGRGGNRDEEEQDEAESRKSYRFTPAQERIPEGARSFILPKDEDGDGQVSMAEFASTWTDSKLREFDSYDADGDGFITGAEYVKKGRPSFRDRRAARQRGE